MSKNAKPSRVKVQEHRQRLRAQGLRPVQIWVPDMRTPGFKAEAHRQSLAVAQSAQAAEDRPSLMPSAMIGPINETGGGLDRGRRPRLCWQAAPGGDCAG